MTGTKQKCDKLNELLLQNKALEEFSRRARELDAPQSVKAEELKYLVLAYFPTVAAAIGRERAAEYEMWLITALLCKAYIIPGDCPLSQEQLRAHHERFIDLFEKTMGKSNVSYNVHIWSHAPLIRERNGPLTEFSAFYNESSYAFVRDW